MGSESERLMKLAEKWCARNYEPLPVCISKGEGVYVWDPEGRKYMDMLSAYSAMSHGHRHPKIINAIVEQTGRVTLTSRAFHNDTLGPFLEKLCALTGFEKALPMNTGAEAVETALKAMRKWAHEVKGVPDGRARIIAAANNFHGRTIAAISMSTSATTKRSFGPLLDGIDIVPFGDADALESAITEETAGVLLEPIQGEGGVVVPPDDYLSRARDICDRRNVLLCLDEIQTGLGRTGKMFCFEHYGIRPDIITLGKALGGGVFPVSAVCANQNVMSVFTHGTHGSTFGGNPLAAAVAIAAMDALRDERMVENSARMGEYFMAKLRELKLPGVELVRGKGLLVGVVLEKPEAHEKSLELLAAGLLAKDARPDIIRFAPPLIITQDQIDEALEIIVKVFK
jgi:ornithine--oxo-acid transaminase